MPLTQLSLNAALSWQINQPVTGFADLVQGSDSLLISLAGISLATWDEIFLAQYVIASSGTQVVDLRSFTDLAGKAITGKHALALIIAVAGAAADVLNVKPGASNPLQWFFGGTTEGIGIPGGGANIFTAGPSATGAVVDATHRNILLTNNGSANLTVTVAALVSDV